MVFGLALTLATFVLVVVVHWLQVSIHDTTLSFQNFPNFSLQIDSLGLRFMFGL